MKLSLCMIVKDEAFFIEECLRSAAPHVDEIVVVDTGSMDGTREIAARLADRLIDFAWIDDFSVARNTALENASGDWILVLDADERIAEADYPRLRAAAAATAMDGLYLITRNYTERVGFHGWQPVSGEEPMARGYRGYGTHRIMKLFRHRADIRYQGRVHEIVDGTVAPELRGELDVTIHHYGEANPDRPKKERALRYLAMMDEELERQPDARLYAIAGSAALTFAEDYPKAYRYLLRAAELGYNPLENRASAAEAAYRGGNFGIAQDIYLELYTGGYRTAPLCLNRANLAVRAGDKALALQLLRECLALGGVAPEIDAVVERNIEHLQGRQGHG